MNALGIALNAAGIFVPLGLQNRYNPPPEGTNVQIIVGSGGNSPGGNVPHIALWDDDGNRIGQRHAGRKEKIKDGEGLPFMVNHNQNGNQPADPYYIMLSNLENDGICIAAITVTNQKISGTFYGDVGYKCGQSWFLSENKIGSNFQKPRCVWLDADHTNKINARALSFHLNDMAPSTDKLAQYQNMPETLCQSTPRFSFWGNLLPDGMIPFFEPKLQYNDDSANSGEGADKNPRAVVDKKDQYNKAVYLHQGEKTKVKKSRTPTIRRNLKARGYNRDPEHLIITDHEGDNIREVCEHPNSYGWDIVSTVENLYCDMEHKQLYNVCGNQFNDNCFDLNNKTIIPQGNFNARDEFAAFVSRKAYTSHAHWKN